MNEQLLEKAKVLASQPYTIQIIQDDSDEDEILYVALNPELDGCLAQGLSVEEAESNLDEFRIEYIAHLLEHNLPVPKPASIQVFMTSNQTAITIPPTPIDNIDSGDSKPFASSAISKTQKGTHQQN